MRFSKYYPTMHGGDPYSVKDCYLLWEIKNSSQFSES
jgi:hypothetical protein